MLESLEGKRGEVRCQTAVAGHRRAFRQPTAVNNVISLATVPIILAVARTHYRDFGMGARVERCRCSWPVTSSAAA